MLADPRSQALVDNFAGQWLYLRNLPAQIPNSNEFPDFDDNLRQAFRRETELFFDSIVREDRSVVDLLTADYTFVNERLARHYGIPNVYGSQFRRVTVTDDDAQGAARPGQHPDGDVARQPDVAGRCAASGFSRTSLGTPPPPPPPNVPPLKDKNARTKPLTMRERMEEHRANPACAGCHKLMDPIGFALENFDAVGAWRTTRRRARRSIASGQLVDGTRVDGPVALRQALLRRPEVFVETLTEKLLTYALGRGVGVLRHAGGPGDRPRAARDNYRFSSIVTGNRQQHAVPDAKEARRREASASPADASPPG